MRVFSYLLAVFCLCFIVGSASATRINIQDPDPQLISTITASPFDVMFSNSCGVLLPGAGASQMGCFGFLNRTSAPWTGIELVLQAPASAFSFTCNDQPAATPVFSVARCGYNAAAGQFELFFTGGLLPNTTTQYFVISEDDLSPDALSFTAYATYATPEPSSWLLLATGVLLVGSLAWGRQRETAL